MTEFCRPLSMMRYVCSTNICGAKKKEQQWKETDKTMEREEKQNKNRKMKPRTYRLFFLYPRI